MIQVNQSEESPKEQDSLDRWLAFKATHEQNHDGDEPSSLLFSPTMIIRKTKRTLIELMILESKHSVLVLGSPSMQRRISVVLPSNEMKCSHLMIEETTVLFNITWNHCWWTVLNTKAPLAKFRRVEVMMMASSVRRKISTIDTDLVKWRAWKRRKKEGRSSHGQQRRLLQHSCSRTLLCG